MLYGRYGNQLHNSIKKNGTKPQVLGEKTFYKINNKTKSSFVILLEKQY